MTTVAITPVYNEERVIVSVLERIRPHVDALIISNDGSTDSTGRRIEDWRRGQPGVYVISARRNAGASMALKKGYALVAHLLGQGVLAPDDPVVEIDSDGQHDPVYIPALVARYRGAAGARVILAQRDFHGYPAIKIWGNRFLTAAASLLAGTRYRDVESNYRVMGARVFPELLRYFWGYRYSGAFEVGIILGRLRYRTDNTEIVRVPYYRAGSRPIDGFHVLGAGLVAWWRLVARRPRQDAEALIREVLTEVSWPEAAGALAGVRQ